MDNIVKNTTKLVLLVVIATLCFLMLYGAFTSKLDYKDITIAFVALLSALQGFYFAYKGDNTQPFAGK